MSNKRAIPGQNDNGFLGPNLVINEYKQHIFWSLYSSFLEFINNNNNNNLPSKLLFELSFTDFIENAKEFVLIKLKLVSRYGCMIGYFNEQFGFLICVRKNRC